MNSHPSASRPAPLPAAAWLHRLLLALPLVARLAGAAEPSWVTGITEPIKDITMAFPTIGVVGARPLEEGATVHPQDVVIELDKRLEELEVERRRFVREQAKSELDRLRSLAERNAISVSREEVDKKQAEFDIARLDYELALATARRRQIVSPVEGEVVRFFKDVGEKCEEQQPVVRIVDTRRCYLVANVDPRMGASLKVGQAMDLEVEAGAAPLPFRGSVSFISPIVDAASGLLRVKILFENPDRKIRPGVTGRLKVN